MRLSNRLHSLLLRATLLALVTTSVGCAGVSLSDLSSMSPSFSLAPTSATRFPSPVTEMTPMGPGHVFSSVDAAAVDALAYCYLESRQVVAANRVARGGAIERVPGGFSYSEPEAAANRRDGRLRYRLAPSDAAHFQYEPKSALGSSIRSSQLLARVARRFVEERDVLGRSLYYLTPERTLHVYSGETNADQALARFEHGTRRGATTLALRSSEGVENAADVEWPVAVQFRRETMTSH